MATPPAHSLEINCTACGKTAFVRAEPVFHGFTKVGEAYICLACGHRYASAAETPFVESTGENGGGLFHATPKKDLADLLGIDGRHHSCRWCAHWILHPFEQRCGLTNKKTESTDECDRFEEKPRENP